MGMFDTVITNFSKIPKGEFQTKGLECNLNTYEIREDGRIYRVFAERDERETSENGLIYFASDEDDQLYITAEIYLSGFDDKDYVAIFENGRLMKFRHASGES